MNVISGLIGIAIFIGIMFAIREVVTWYTKATRLVEQNDKIIELLFTIAKFQEKQASKPAEVPQERNRIDKPKE